MDTLTRTRLEKAGADCGFERTPELVDGALVLRSSKFPEFVAIRMLEDSTFEIWSPSTSILATGPVCAGVRGYNAVYDVLQKAAATARTMPNRVANKFHEATAELPRSTEAERLVVQRVGQNLFRAALLDYWHGTCCITGLSIPALLRASHAKPWALCKSDEERLDVFNGLLLAPNLDALFDGGWMTVLANGRVIFSGELTVQATLQLGVDRGFEVRGLTHAHQAYFQFHREQIFKK